MPERSRPSGLSWSRKRNPRRNQPKRPNIRPTRHSLHPSITLVSSLTQPGWPDQWLVLKRWDGAFGKLSNRACPLSSSERTADARLINSGPRVGNGLGASPSRLRSLSYSGLARNSLATEQSVAGGRLPAIVFRTLGGAGDPHQLASFCDAGARGPTMTDVARFLAGVRFSQPL
jgi:hypothetical protein